MSNKRYLVSLKTLILGLVLVPTGLVWNSHPSLSHPFHSHPFHSQPIEQYPRYMAQATGQAERWLDVEEIRGDVIYRDTQSRSAQVGDRLSTVGQGITTLDRSSALLEVDSSIGHVRVAANTTLEVDELEVLQDGARVTVLNIIQGQVRVQARRFTNPNTRLEVHSPSGIAAVRGTDFGISVGEEGNMAIATESGLVEVSAQSQSVQVAPGQVSTIQMGEAPTPPRLMDRQLDMDIHRQELVGGRVVMKITVDPANRIVCNGEAWTPEQDGTITVRIPSHHSFLRMVVQNPLGEMREHVVWVDED